MNKQLQHMQPLPMNLAGHTLDKWVINPRLRDGDFYELWDPATTMVAGNVQIVDGPEREECLCNAAMIATCQLMYSALRDLAVLGNGNLIGNSTGNKIAVKALSEVHAVFDELTKTEFLK